MKSDKIWLRDMCYIPWASRKYCNMLLI